MGDSASSSPLIGQIILMIILTVINAIFAAAELAFVSVDHRKMEDEAEEGDKAATRVLKLLENSDDFLSTIQVAITFAGFLNSASAATSIAGYITPLLGNIPGAETISVLIVTLIISYITLVFGELVPKSVALQDPNGIAKGTSGIISFANTLFKPFVWLLTASTNLIKGIIPMDFSETEEKMTRDEFRAYLDQSRHDEVIDLSEFSMLKGVLSLDHKITREIMVPRTDTMMIDYDDGNEANIAKLLDDLQYSRVPMYYEDKDNIMGIIHIKNVMKASTMADIEDIDLKDIMNDALFVPETLFVDDLLIELRRTRNQMAIVADEYGGVVGLVTLENIIEEIVGDIDDEYDEINKDVEIVLEDEEYLVSGSMFLHDFNDFFNTAISSEAVDTIAGYYIAERGLVSLDSNDERNTHEDAFLQIDNYKITVETIEGARIVDLRVTYNPVQEEENDEISEAEED